LGAAGGAALGGVEGAFAGAAIGAVAGGVRQSIGETASYAAEIEKLKIALRGILPEQEKFDLAIRTASQATSELNIPQEQSIKGMTRLAAAVTGAKGPVQDAALTFRNVTAAIKATGGSSEDVQGAITAMVQVFSKGKVSAEELSGQLGERLPGAVTMFAKANEMTLPELQKNLKAGTVGLNELMNFIIELGVEFDGTARKISDSNADAGARLNVVIQEMRAAIGKELLPIGAEFQKAFAKFIEEITPKLVEIIPKIARFILNLVKNIDKVVAALVGFFKVLAVGKIMLFVGSIKTLGAAKIGLLRNVVALKKAFIGLNSTLLLNPYAIAAAGAAALSVHIFSAIQHQNKLNNLLKKGSVQQVENRLSQLQSEQAALEQESLKPKGLAGKTVDSLVGLLIKGAGVEGSEEGVNILLDRNKREQERLNERLTLIKDLRPEQGAAVDLSGLSGFTYDPLNLDGSDAGTGTKSTLSERIKQAQELEARMQRQLMLAKSQGEIGRLLAKQVNDRAVLTQKILDLKKDGTNKDLNAATANATQKQQQLQQLEIQTKLNQLFEKAERPLKQGLAAIKERLDADRRYKELLKKGIEPARAKDIINLEKLKKKGLEILDIEIEALKAVVAKNAANKEAIETLDKLIKKRKEMEGIDPETETGGNNYGKDKSDFESFKESFTAGLEDMVNIGPKIANVALNAIGSVTDGLIEMITTGKANFKEMAASILKDLAKIMMKAALAKIVASAFGITLSAKGNVIQGGTIKPYAKGGVVAAPTVFPMAGGDVGLMGEAGPEAIMPLKRGNNGKLGIEVAGRSNAVDAMNRYSRRNTAAAGGGMASEDEAIAAVQGSAVPIDVRYSVERINSVDYVTADQFQNGMQQAAQQGAKQGEQQTLKRLQMSSSTRKRLGM